MFKGREILVTFDVANFVAGVVLVAITLIPVSNTERFCFWAPLLLILAFDISIAKNKNQESRGQIDFRVTFRGATANRFRTLKELRGINDDHEFHRDMLRICEYIIQEHHLGTKFYRSEGDGEPIEIDLLKLPDQK